MEISISTDHHFLSTKNPMMKAKMSHSVDIYEDFILLNNDFSKIKDPNIN